MFVKKSKKIRKQIFTKYRVVYVTKLYYDNVAKCIYEIAVSVHYNIGAVFVISHC